MAAEIKAAVDRRGVKAALILASYEMNIGELSQLTGDAIMFSRMMLTIAGFLPALSGCGFALVGSGQQAIPGLKAQVVDRMEIRHARVYQDGEGLALFGIVDSASFGGTIPSSGHIDVVIRTPDKPESSAVVLPVQQTPHDGYFGFKTATLPPPGSKVLIRYHEDAHSLD